MGPITTNADRGRPVEAVSGGASVVASLAPAKAQRDADDPVGDADATASHMAWLTICRLRQPRALSIPELGDDTAYPGSGRPLPG